MPLNSLSVLYISLPLPSLYQSRLYNHHSAQLPLPRSDSILLVAGC